MTDLGVEALREIRTRVDAATPGPWYATQDLDWSDDESAVGVARGDHQADDDSYAMVLVTPGSGSFDVTAEAIERRVENAEFAAHARQDVPHLLDLVEVLAVAATAGRPTAVYVAVADYGLNGAGVVRVWRDEPSADEVAAIGDEPAGPDAPFAHRSIPGFSGIRVERVEVVGC